MKTIEYWEVTESFDRDSKLIGNFSSELVANQVVAKSKVIVRHIVRSSPCLTRLKILRTTLVTRSAQGRWPN